MSELLTKKQKAEIARFIGDSIKRCNEQEVQREFFHEFWHELADELDPPKVLPKWEEVFETTDIKQISPSIKCSLARRNGFKFYCDDKGASGFHVRDLNCNAVCTIDEIKRPAQ